MDHLPHDLSSKLSLVSASDPEAQSSLVALDEALRSFYNRQNSAEYYTMAEHQNQDWTGKAYHQSLLGLVEPGMEVLEMGCGSAHAFVNMRSKKPRYTGVDWSESQIRDNRKRFGAEAEFFAGSIYQMPLETERYDLVFSLYVLEHTVWPHLFLQEAFRLTKPGGLLAILCPQFRPAGRIPSLRFGNAIAPLRAKIHQGSWFDAAVHLWNRNIRFPAFIRHRFPRQSVPFLINLNPTCLSGPYYADNDAVYFVDRKEVVDTLAGMGAADVTDSLAAPAPQNSNVCFIIAKKQAK